MTPVYGSVVGARLSAPTESPGTPFLESHHDYGGAVLQLVSDGRVDLPGMLTHAFALSEWREAFTALATQTESNAIKVAFHFR